MKELHIRVLEGRWGSQVEYALRYPSTDTGGTPFDRYWRQRMEAVRRHAARETGRFPTRYSAEWQETRRDKRFCSGFIDISRRVGHGDWTLWRSSATFGPVGSRPLTMNSLLGQNWRKALQPLILQRLEGAAEGEVPFFRGWQRRAGAFLDAGRFYLTGEGLCIWFPQESLAPKNAGLPTVILPYEESPLLQPVGDD